MHPQETLVRAGLLSVPSGILMRPSISQGYIKGKQHVGRNVPEQGCCKLPKGLVSCEAPRFFGALGGTPHWCGYLGVTHGLVNSSKKNSLVHQAGLRWNLWFVGIVFI